jgi:F-type H+-transporting ATPase subunit alpha
MSLIDNPYTEKHCEVVKLFLAQPVSTELVDRLIDAFCKEHHLVRATLEFSVIYNPRLVGGFAFYYCGKIYDYSVQQRMDQMTETISAVMTKSVSKEMPNTADELYSQLSSQLKQFELDKAEPIVHEAGTVLRVSDGIAHIEGLAGCAYNELLIFESGAEALALNLDEFEIGAALLSDADNVTAGSICRTTGRIISVPVGDQLLGRVINALGEPIDNLGPIDSMNERPLESPAASVVDREPVTVPLYTGITAIDAMTPIGRGQRELIIGDRQTGKTTIALNTILNQANENVKCVYVAIGQKLSTVASIVNTLKRNNALKYTTVVVAGAAEMATMQYLAPYAGAAVAEHWLYQGEDVLIVYDDLSKHAQAYRNISLLLRRPPGREAFPGDIFYLHSRLLERAARLNTANGGGSLTALPIVETLSGDISAYIPTNLISITDGQIYLEIDLFFAGQRPAINVGLSVSRVGGNAQTKAMKQVAGTLRLNLAQYTEIASFSQFASNLDKDTREQLSQGKSIMEVLKQPRNQARTAAESIILLDSANLGLFTKLESEDIPDCVNFILTEMRAHDAALLLAITVSKEYSSASKTQAINRITAIIEDFLVKTGKRQAHDPVI